MDSGIGLKSRARYDRLPSDPSSIRVEQESKVRCHHPRITRLTGVAL
jgi:hypothetical protein